MDSRNSDETLIEAIKNEDESALVVLTKRYKNVCLAVGWKYKINFEGEEMSLIYEAAKSYDKLKNTKFSTWLYNHTFYKIKAIQRKTNKEREFIDNYMPAENARTEAYSTEELLDFIENKRIKQIITLRHLGDTELTYEEIGKILGLSRQMIMKDYQKGLEIIRRKMKNNG